MLNPRFVLSLCLLSAFMLSAQPTKPPKLFPKFASQNRGASLAPNPRLEAQKLDLEPQTAIDQTEKEAQVDSNEKPKAEEPAGIEWLTFEEALEKQKDEPRKIYLDVYTEWCGWCKRMDQTTFADADVVKAMNEHFYAVKFDAEQKEDIEFNGKTYKFVNSGRRGHHELAQYFLNGRMGYPTSVFLDESLSVIQPIPGYLDASKMDMILQYFGTDSYQKTPGETFEKQYAGQKTKPENTPKKMTVKEGSKD